MKRAERKEIDLLSKDVFGSSSRWQKLVGKGYDELVTEDVEETVPAEKEGEEPTKQTIKKPVLANGARQLLRKYHTVESILEFMIEQKKQLDVFRAQLQKQKEEFFAKLQAEQAAKQAKTEAENLVKELQSTTAGSAKE